MADEKEADEQHKTSLAFWDLDSPVVVGRTGRMKVGAKCSAGCVLTDQRVEIRDANGTSVARAGLSAEPWPGTAGLYWAELEFPAPSNIGTHVWSIASPHGDAVSNFTFFAVVPPEHTLTIHVRDKESQAPLAEAEVRLGPYRAASDDRGVATIELPTGNFSLSIWKVGYEQFTTTVDVTSTMTVDVEIAVEPEPEQKYWM
jgi:carboxypeptidase family protein